MALFPGVKEVDVTQFKGAIVRADAYSIDPEHGIYSQNVKYVRGADGQSQVQTRLGFGAAWQIYLGEGPVLSMAFWSFVQNGTLTSAVLYYTSAVGIRGYQLTGTGAPAPTGVLMPITGAAGASVAINAQRMVAAFYTASGQLPSTDGYVYGWGVGADKLFSPPMTIVPTLSETATGTCTAGVHYIAYLPTTRNGYTTKLSPTDSGGTLIPPSITSSGGKNIHVVLTGTIPTYMTAGSSQIQVCMTTVANPNRWFAVPGAIITPVVSPSGVNIDIDDATLAANGTDVTDYLNLYTQSPGGISPFLPTSVALFGSRMAYLTSKQSNLYGGQPAVFFSEPNNYQALTLDQHCINLPGQANPIAGFQLRDVFYVCSPFSMYSMEDNGDKPITWTPPQRVDGSVGVLSPTCVLSRPEEGPSLGYALIASERGFFLFQGGSFPAIPLSYYQTDDWSRINWLVPTTIKIAEDQLNRKFIVTAPLNDSVASVSGSGPYTITTVSTHHQYQTGLTVTIDGVSGIQTITVTGENTFTISGSGAAAGAVIRPQTATHRLTWDYADGPTVETVKYSLDAFAAYPMGALVSVQNPNNNLVEVWYGPSVASSYLIRQNLASDPHPYSDVDSTGALKAINCIYQTSLLPNDMQDAQSTIHDYHGMHLRVLGSGNLAMQAAGVDNSVTVTPALSPMALSPSPGKEYLVKWYLRSERQSITLSMNGIDSYFILSLIRAYYNDSLLQR